MVEFRKLKTLTSDTMVSQYLADMYDGGTVNADLLGGMTKNKYLFQSSVAERPTFGDAQLKSLDFDFYVNSISIGENTTKYPEVASYLLKEGVNVTEGYASRVDTDILAFSSVMDGFNSAEDIMDGTGVSGGDGTEYVNIARTIFRKDVLYTTVDEAYDHGQKGYKWRHGSDKHSKAEIRRDFGVTGSSLGFPSASENDSSTNYIKVSSTKKGSWVFANKWGAMKKRYYRKCMPNEAHTGIGYEIWVPDSKCQAGNTDMSTTDGYGNEVTPANTIFEFVRGSAEFSDWDNDANAQALLAVGIPRFNTTDFLTGSQSLEMFTFWTGHADNKLKASYDGKSGGPSDRQECLLVKKNIPYPNKKPRKPSKTRDGIHRTVTADVSANNFIAEGHGLTEGTIVYVEDGWNGITGTAAGIGGDWEDDYGANGAYVRNVTADTFQLAVTNADAYMYALSQASNLDKPMNLKIADPNNAVFGGNASVLAQASFDDYDYSEHASVIKMDINIKKLAKAHSHKTDEGEIYQQDGTTPESNTAQHFLTLRRGFHVVFGTVAPENKETIYDYIGRMSNLREQSGQANAPYRVEGPGWDGITGTDDSDTIWAIGASGNHDKGNTQNPCFGGFSILNTEHGLQVIPFNGVQGTSDIGDKDAWGACGLYIADHDLHVTSSGDASRAKGDLFFKQATGFTADDYSVHGATGGNHQVPIEDQWCTFTLSFNPHTSIPYKNGHEDSGRSSFSLGRLHITDSDGEIVKLGHAKNTGEGADGKDYLDLALFGDGEARYSYKENPGNLTVGSFEEGHKYQIVTAGNTNWTSIGAANGNVGTIFIKNGTAATGTGTAKSLSQDPSNWPKHMSIWLTNAKETKHNDNLEDQLREDDSDCESKVLIDSIEFKDFNYEITNSSQLDSSTLTSPIKIENGRGFLSPKGLFPAFDARADHGANTSTLDSYATSTPCILSFGLKSRDYLSNNSTTASANYFPWTEWPYGFWLNDFSAANLSKVGDIPDAHIKGTVSMAAYTDTPDIIPLGDQLGQKGIDYTEANHLYQAGSLISHNGYLAYDDYGHGGTSSFATGWLNTGLKVSTNDVSAKQFVLAQQAQFTGASIPIPIRVGDKVRLVENNSYRGGSSARSYEYTVATVTGAMHETTGAGNSLTFTVSETPTLAGDGGESNSDDWASDYIAYVQTPALCRNFSQKGGFQFYNNSVDEHCAVKRENISASARIMEITESNTSGTTIGVDTMEPFLCDDDEEYVVYLWGETPTFTDVNGLPDRIADNSANCATAIKILSKDTETNSITLDWDGKDNAGTNILSYDNIHRLYISPWRYWIFIMINLTDASGQELSTRQYGNIQLMNNNWVDKNSVRRSWVGEALHNTSSNDYVDTAYANRTGLGTTFNEFLFNDTTTGGVNGAYLNNWELDRMPEHSQLECDTDFGFGEYNEDTLTGGFTGKQVVVDSQYNRIKMPKIIEGSDLEVGDTVSFLLDYNDVGLSHKTNFKTRAATDYPPYLFTVFEDIKPDNPVLTVAPYEPDPFLPEFKWEASGDDLWYGILHIDSKSIDSQYHNAIFHMPMNESGVHGATVSTAGNDLYANDTTVGSTSKTALFTYSGATVDAEGLAGNCIRFDGDDDVITYTPSSGDTFPELETAVASGGTGQASIVVHVTPDNGISGTVNEIFKGMPFHIKYDADNGKIIADVYTAASNYVRLTSPDIITDGQTPTCIIVTLDNSLKSGNVKLFINGALVDQSGQISNTAPATDGTGKNWHNSSGTPAVPYTYTTAATIGNGTNSFDGRIEELVIYKSCIYPVVPNNGSFVLDKPLKEISGETPISNNARLFIKDYHNIRGSTTFEVAASSPVSFRKAAFRLKD